MIALTAQGEVLHEKAKAVPLHILAASGCSIAELSGLRKSLVALRDQLNAVSG